MKLNTLLLFVCIIYNSCILVSSSEKLSFSRSSSGTNTYSKQSQFNLSGPSPGGSADNLPDLSSFLQWNQSNSQLPFQAMAQFQSQLSVGSASLADLPASTLNGFFQGQAHHQIHHGSGNGSGLPNGVSGGPPAQSAQSFLASPQTQVKGIYFLEACSTFAGIQCFL
jgi:hypothetical protein